jgi:hypothetical protein
MKAISEIVFLCSLFCCLSPFAAEEPALVWRDAETGRTLFTSNDVVTFDWERQTFLLKLDATLDFLAWVPPHMHQSRRLLVEDEARPIYLAHWVSPMSSMSFSGPIYKPLSPNPLFSIASAYPVRRAWAEENQDARFDPRLREGLAKAGVLGALDSRTKYGGLVIETVDQEWKQVQDDLKVRIQYFKNTFRLDRMARAHIFFFAGGPKTQGRLGSLALEIKFIANDGTFRSDTRIQDIPTSVLEDGIFVCEWDPWQPTVGSDRNAKRGVGYVSVTIFFNAKQGDTDNTLYRLEFSESRVPIAGKAPPV